MGIDKIHRGIMFPDGTVQNSAANGGGSQTPWTSDIDAAGHVLNNVGGYIGISGTPPWNPPSSGQFLEITTYGAQGAIGTTDYATGSAFKLFIAGSDVMTSSNSMRLQINASDLEFWNVDTGNLLFSISYDGAISFPYLPSTNPGAGSKQLWYDPSDGNRVKFAA
jgi:hypothetical protein